MSSFALLDDCKASAAQPTSRLYTDLQQELTCDVRCGDTAGFDGMMQQLQSALEQGLFAVALFCYELGLSLQTINRNDSILATPSRILLYKSCQHLSRDQVNTWLQQHLDGEQDGTAGIAGLRASVDEAEFTQSIARIQDYIAAGDTYQVNYTFRFHFDAYGSVVRLYQRLRQRQSVPYGALIELPDGTAVLSLSPELFVRHQAGVLYARPMKGTAPASNTGDSNEDDLANLQRSLILSTDVKNRAENVMIVDLLRNDLSRVAKPGTVQVPHLFEVQRFNSVLQMTSDVCAQLQDRVTLAQLIRAIYPCGSITGAPKLRTMEIILELESEPRGIYTGAIGWFDPTAPAAIPNFCLSVPIRTLSLQAPGGNGLRQGVMGVGAGIVFDSVAADEYQESLLKARFLTELPAQFGLFETMRATREEGCRHFDRHLQRLAKSAQYFGVPLALTEIKLIVQTTCAGLPENTLHRLKLSVDGNGAVTVQCAPLADINQPVRVMLADTRQLSDQLWLQHKTTQRRIYDTAWQTAEQHGAFDMLFCNEYGAVTEGGRSNLLYKLDGRWFTPPLTDGVLPGIMRSVLLDDPVWAITERSIQLDKLRMVQEIAVCNALRGVMLAVLD